MLRPPMAAMPALRKSRRCIREYIRELTPDCLGWFLSARGAAQMEDLNPVISARDKGKIAPDHDVLGPALRAEELLEGGACDVAHQVGEDPRAAPQKGSATLDFLKIGVVKRDGCLPGNSDRARIRKVDGQQVR